MLLTRSRGVQTELGAYQVHQEDVAHRAHEVAPSMVSTGTSPSRLADTSETSSLHEHRSSALLGLIETMGKLLGKLRTADIPTLNKRLKKQHLPGDVGHLSQSTLRNLHLEVTDLRHLFRGPVDIGTVSRRELTMLLKLFKDVFNELISLQAIVNDVTVEPSLAKKLQKDAYRDEDDSDLKASKQAQGLAWIAAPITKFFVTSAGETSGLDGHNASPRPGRGLEKSRLQPVPVKPVPKQQASTSATTTHISVEFGGSGMVRRATPAAPQVVEGLPPLPNGIGNEMQAQQMDGTISGSTTGEKLRPPTLRASETLRPSKSRANRNELLGIFAGAARPVTPTDGGPWQVLGNGDAPSTGGSRQIRAVSSQHFGDKTVRQRDVANQRKQLSVTVDAVIDSKAEQLAPDDASSFQPALLERTLRRRGLSDSSIRSTFVTHANPGDRLVTASSVASGPAPRAIAYGSSFGTEKPGVLESLASRFYTFRGAVTDISPVNPGPPGREQADARALVVAQTVPPPAHPIASSILPNRPDATSATVSTLSQAGIFSMLASSLTRREEADTHDQHGVVEEEDEMVGAALRHPIHVPRTARTLSAKGDWQ